MNLLKLVKVFFVLCFYGEVDLDVGGDESEKSNV